MLLPQEDTVTAVVSRLDGLDFSDLEAVIVWLCDYCLASLNLAVAHQHDLVLCMFAKHGYTAKLSFAGLSSHGSRQNFGRGIIELTLFGMRGRQKSGVYLSTARQWLDRYGRKQQAERLMALYGTFPNPN